MKDGGILRASRLAFDTRRPQAATLLKSRMDGQVNVMLDTLANAQLYRAAGFTDAQAKALVERDRMVEAARGASSLPCPSQLAVNANPFGIKAHLDRMLADQWKLAFAVATIAIVGFCDTTLVLALKYWTLAGK